MKTMSLRMPDYLKNAVNDVCANEKVSLQRSLARQLRTVFYLKIFKLL